MCKDTAAVTGIARYRTLRVARTRGALLSWLVFQQQQQRSVIHHSRQLGGLGATQRRRCASTKQLSMFIQLQRYSASQHASYSASTNDESSNATDNKRAFIIEPKRSGVDDTTRDAVSTCAQKPTWVSSIYRTETTTTKCKKRKITKK